MSKSRGSGLLITGVVFIVLAAVGGVMSVMGMNSMKSGAEALTTAGEGTEASDPISINVPGETTVDLDAKKYGVWATNPRFNTMDSDFEVDMPDSDLDTPDGEPETPADDTGSTEPPDVSITITGNTDVPVSTSGEMRMGNQVQIGSFEITEAGSYTVATTVAEEEVDDTTYTIDDDAMAAMTEVGGDLAATGLGFLQMVGGGACGGVFGLIGLILVAVHFMRR